MDYGHVAQKKCHGASFGDGRKEEEIEKHVFFSLNLY